MKFFLGSEAQVNVFLRGGGNWYVCFVFCLFVCLFVCLRVKGKGY